MSPRWGCLAFQQRVQRLGIERPRKLFIPLDAGDDRLLVFTSQSHVLLLSSLVGIAATASRRQTQTRFTRISCPFNESCPLMAL